LPEYYTDPADKKLGIKGMKWSGMSDMAEGWDHDPRGVLSGRALPE